MIESQLDGCVIVTIIAGTDAPFCGSVSNVNVGRRFDKNARMSKKEDRKWEELTSLRIDVVTYVLANKRKHDT